MIFRRSLRERPALSTTPRDLLLPVFGLKEMRSPKPREVFFVAMVISVKCFGRWILYNSACFRPFENPRPLPDAPGDRRDTATVPSIQDSLLGNLGGCFCVLDLGFCTRSSTPRPLGTRNSSLYPASKCPSYSYVL